VHNYTQILDQRRSFSLTGNGLCKKKKKEEYSGNLVRNEAISTNPRSRYQRRVVTLVPLTDGRERGCDLSEGPFAPPGFQEDAGPRRRGGGTVKPVSARPSQTLRDRVAPVRGVIVVRVGILRIVCARVRVCVCVCHRGSTGRNESLMSFF